MVVKHGPHQGTCVRRQIHLTHGLAKSSWGFRILVMYQTQKSGCHILFNMVTECHWRFFGHIACSAPTEDHQRAVAVVIFKTPPDWKWPPGRPNHIWLRATESYLRPLNIDPSYTWKNARSENTGVQLWTWLRSKRVWHKDRDRVKSSTAANPCWSWQLAHMD